MNHKARLLIVALLFTASVRLPASERPLSEKLERIVDVCFRRDSFCNVVEELKAIGGLKIVYPFDYTYWDSGDSHYGSPGDEFFTFSFEGHDLELRDVLERLAKDSGTQLEFRSDTVVFWRKIDDATLESINKLARSTTSTERVTAVRKAAECGDPRIYPILFKALKDPDERVVESAMQALRAHAGTFQFGEGVDDAVETLLARWEKHKPAQLRNHSGANGVELQYTELLCASRSKKAARLLLEEIVTVNLDRNHFIAGDLAETATEDLLDPLLEISGRKELRGPKEEQGANQEASPREFAAMVLAGIDSPRACSECLKIVNEERPYLKQFAPYVLSRCRDPRAIDKLLEMDRMDVYGALDSALRLSRQPRVLDAAFNALREKENALRNDHGSFFREERFVKELLRQADTPQNALRWSTQLGATCDARAEAPLIAAAKLNDERWGEHPIKALARLGTELTQNAIMTMLLDPAFRDRTIRAISQEPRSAPIVLRALKEGDATLRSALAAGLLPHTQFAYGCRCWTPHVIALLQDPDENVRKEAFRSLSQQKELRAIEAIAAYLKNPDPAIRQSVAEALGTNADPLTVDPLLQAAADPDEHVCAAAVRSLGGFVPGNETPSADEVGHTVVARRGYDSRVVSTLLPFIDGKREQVRSAALKTLPLVSGEEDFVKLLPLLRETRVDLRRAGLSAVLGAVQRQHKYELAKIDAAGWPEIRELLKTLIRDPDGEVRQTAMSIVTSLNDAGLSDALIALQKDPDPVLRREVVEAFDQDERFFKYVTAALSDNDENVRITAIKIVGGCCAEGRCELIAPRYEPGTEKEREAVLEQLKGNAYGLKSMVPLLSIKDAKLREPILTEVEQRLDQLDDEQVKLYEKATGKSLPRKQEPAKPMENEF